MMNDETIIIITNETIVYWDDERNEIVVLIGNDERRIKANDQRDEDDFVLLVGPTICLIIGNHTLHFEIDEAAELIEGFEKAVRGGVIWKD